MNQLNETLSVIRRQKAVLSAKYENETEEQTQKQLAEKIDKLSAEEQRILHQLGVKFDSNNR